MMRQLLKLYLSQLVCCAIIFLLYGAYFSYIVDREVINPPRLGSDFLLGLLFSFIAYGIGASFTDQLYLNSESILARLTPLRSPLLLRRALVRSAVGLVVFLLLIPCFTLAAIYPWQKQPALSGRPLLGVNLVLTYLLLLVYNLHLTVCGAPWRWNFFFFMRRALLYLVFAVLYPVRYLKIFWLAILGVGGWYGHQALLDGLMRGLAWLVDQGVPGRLALYLFSPGSGLVFLNQPEVPPLVHQVMAVVLAGLLIVCCAGIWRHLLLQLEERERRELEAWQESPELFQDPAWDTGADEGEEDEDFARDNELNARPAMLLGNAVADGAAAEGHRADTGEPGAPVADEKPPETGQLLQLEYSPGLPPEEQIWRHHRFWSLRWGGLRGALGACLNPWWFSGALALSALASALGWEPRQALSHWNEGALVVTVIVVMAVFLIFQAAQVSAILDDVAAWGWLIPLRWPTVMRKALFSPRRERLALDLAWILVLSLVLDVPPRALWALPVLLFLNRVDLLILYWFSARASVTGRKAVQALVCLLYVLICFVSIIWMGFAFGQKGKELAEAWMTLALLYCAIQTVFLTPCLLLIGWTRLGADFQVVSQPTYRMFVI